LKRDPQGFKKVGKWEWKRNPFIDKPEFNGLRVLMALINNWDLKDSNTGIYDSDSERIYMISDLGATFGTTRVVFGREQRRGNLLNLEKSAFITKVSPGAVDFATPGTPSMVLLAVPNVYTHRESMKWIGDNIPRSDVKWMALLLSQLTPQ